MKPVHFRLCALVCVVLLLLSGTPKAAASSYCPGCGAAIVGVAVAIGVGVGVGIYLIHRSHTSLTGCVSQTDHGLSLTGKDGNNYELVNPPSAVKAGTRLWLRGHKSKTPSGNTFRVDRVARDYGTCAP